MWKIKLINRTWNYCRNHNQQNHMYTCISWLNLILNGCCYCFPPRRLIVLIGGILFCFVDYTKCTPIVAIWPMHFMIMAWDGVVKCEMWYLPFGGIGDASTVPLMLTIWLNADLFRLVLNAKVKITPISNQFIILLDYHITDWKHWDIFMPHFSRWTTVWVSACVCLAVFGPPKQCRPTRTTRMTEYKEHKFRCDFHSHSHTHNKQQKTRIHNSNIFFLSSLLCFGTIFSYLSKFSFYFSRLRFGLAAVRLLSSRRRRLLLLLLCLLFRFVVEEKRVGQFFLPQWCKCC